MIERRTVTEHYPEHVAECQRRWELALGAEGFDAALIHAGSEIISFMDDYHYPFRPNPHFLQWLPLTHHHDSALLIRAGETPRLYYYQPDDYWYLPPADPDSWWADHFDVRPVRDPDAWRLDGFGERTAFIGDAPSLAEVAGKGALNPARLVNRIHLQRTGKTPYELACMAEASRLAAHAHLAAETAFREGCSEYEIHQRYCRASGMLDHELPYGNIVALNDHGAVLHYQQRDHEAPGERHSFLIDAGATHHAYCSDITRTYAAGDGEFAGLIDSMAQMQQVLCGEMLAGADYRDLHVETHRRIAGILRDHGVITVSADEAVDTGLSSVFFPHGLGHFLGLQTHDVAGLIADTEGTEIPRPGGHPFLRLTRTLEPGNVLTVEPGLYFIDTLLSKWRENGDAGAVNWDKVEALSPCGGIRIEDNVVVTESEPRNLTQEAFAAVSPR
jgi:Xaa-Pro dipeptidase